MFCYCYLANIRIDSWLFTCLEETLSVTDWSTVLNAVWSGDNSPVSVLPFY